MRESGVLLTGATGCLGRALVSRLKEKNTCVMAPVRHPKKEFNQCLNLETVRWDRKNAWLEGAKGKVSVIVHAAAVTPSTGSHFGINRRLTEETLKWAEFLNAKHYILISTAGVLGEVSSNQLRDETAKASCRDDYQRSKWESEERVRSFCHKKGIPYTILRPAIIYGPFDRGILRKLIWMADHGFYLMVGSGKNRKSFISSRTLAEFTEHCILNERVYGDFFQVVEPTPRSVLEIGQMLSELLFKKLLYLSIPTSVGMFFGPAGMNFFRRASSNNCFTAKKLEDRLEVKISDDFKEGLREEVLWYVERNSQKC